MLLRLVFIIKVSVILAIFVFFSISRKTLLRNFILGTCKLCKDIMKIFIDKVYHYRIDAFICIKITESLEENLRVGNPLRPRSFPKFIFFDEIGQNVAASLAAFSGSQLQKRKTYWDTSVSVGLHNFCSICRQDSEALRCNASGPFYK